MNWGHKITLVIIAFIIGMLGMVYVASKQTNEMMDDHYYEKELAHQSLINASENLQTISNETLITQTDEQVQIKIPAGLYTNITEGSIQFLRNNDKSKDYYLLLQPEPNTGVQIIAKAKFIKGVYKTRIKWRNNGKLYYCETDVFIK